MNLRLITSFLIVVLFFIQCKEEETTLPYNINQLWDCHNAATWNVETVKTAIIGEWQLEYVTCYGTLGAVSDVRKGNHTVRFTENGFERFENGTLEDSGTWNIEESNTGLYNLRTEPRIGEFFGDILLCENNLTFYGSPLDACDNFYKKEE